MKRSARARFIIFVVLLDEMILVAIVLFVLWKLGVHLPLWTIITVAVALGVWFFVQYRIIVPILNRREMTGSQGMLGLKGKVMAPLAPKGYIKIGGELWEAFSTDTNIGIDEEVIIVGITGLKLIVRREKGS